MAGRSVGAARGNAFELDEDPGIVRLKMRGPPMGVPRHGPFFDGRDIDLVKEDAAIDEMRRSHRERFYARSQRQENYSARKGEAPRAGTVEATVETFSCIDGSGTHTQQEVQVDEHGYANLKDFPASGRRGKR